ncbi:aldehyde dehydrogenase family protein [Labrys wisconsinensis]|uniref:Succinate-semialdehyde dehydrogenase/glutarate-semialdehyde dehydrogenase n=1 Tax=Labrys wisconsinensis TaxID=425677 RepID=A0ABU0JD68_9HYPH|nr:NAD-dependent succinate-semialdehyde dehydrogenase [Labrys wisconsinensis]MDQ0471343.1 succinate-semialdehyde dehydrogenase/glutarate-semialdehyde dehydrogenase [Labrys wisconsinensis]
MTDVKTHANYIDGRWTAEGVTEWLDVANPATEAVIARVPQSGAALVDQAVAAARQAFPAWRDLGPHRRAEILRRAAGRVAAAREPIARAMTREQGKPLNEALGEVDKLAKTFGYYAEEAVRILGYTAPNEEAGHLSLVEKEPIGVAAAIAPWNYPVELIGWKLGAGLAAGCTLVVKPSEWTPLSAIGVIDCLHEAGLPPGVVNLVIGDGRTGQALVSHPDVDKIAFTGSLAVGEAIFRTMGGIKSVSLELGGNCPLIVAPSADLDAAVKGAVRRSFRNMGQVCIAINRIYVHRPHYERFVADLVAATRRLVIADGIDDPAADLGPMTNAAGLAKVRGHVEDALAKGARLACGGRRPEGRPVGHFYEPTVLADCTPDMLVMQAETFGPVVGVSACDTLDEAVALANASPYGLAAYAYARDAGEIFALGRRLSFGSVAINTVDAGTINAPYGGRRKSGIGSEHGREGMEGYLQLKHVRIRHGA